MISIEVATNTDGVIDSWVEKRFAVTGRTLLYNDQRATKGSIVPDLQFDDPTKQPSGQNNMADMVVVLLIVQRKFAVMRCCCFRQTLNLLCQMFASILSAMKNTYIVVVLMVALFVGCSESDDDYPNTLIHTEELSFYVDTLAVGLENPWGMEFLPDGSVLIAERPGRLRIWRDGGLSDDLVENIPEIWAHGQGGLLDVVKHPDFNDNQLIYLVHAARANGGGSTAITRGRLSGDALYDVETIFHAHPLTEAGHHFGSRIVFDDEGYLFSTIGDRGVMMTSQDLSSHNGTVIRLYDDGTVPSDNPFADEPDALPEIYSYGHRNIQGMKLHPETRALWTHEHGPQGGDEINLIRAGENYGWPLVTHGINYDGTVITPDTTAPGMVDPIYHWTPSIAPCGLTFVDSDRYVGWRHNMLVGALAGQHIHRVVLKDNRVEHTEKMLEGMARFRAIEQGPDGFIYVLTEHPGLFFRLVPGN